MNKYCNNLFKYSRFKTREVKIGDIGVGGKNPIRLQSMTTTNTMDTISTVEQSIRMIDAGCEYVRITAPSMKQARNLINIKKELSKRGYRTPLIADIHFTPNAAEIAAEIVEKVRINPGNYVDKKKFEVLEYTDEEYNREIERIYDRVSPLIKICKKNGTAMRIGTNHGSLSDRIMNKYGDTPNGMVESAMEFLRICEDHNYYNIVLSMKSSNPIVMVQAYRLLVNKMIKENMNYPLHLGVTEAGEGMEGRVKSAVGIGALLEDGLGDTIRVSLTEEPEFELPVAKDIVDRYTKRPSYEESKLNKYYIDPFNYQRRNTYQKINIGYENVPRVIADLSSIENIDYEVAKELGYHYSTTLDKWNISDSAVDYLYLGDKEIKFVPPPQLKVICNFQSDNYQDGFNLKFSSDEYLSFNSNTLKFVEIGIDTINSQNLLDKIKNDNNLVIILKNSLGLGIHNVRLFFNTLVQNDIKAPVIMNLEGKNIQDNKLQIDTSVDFGSLLVDGFSDGIMLSFNSNIDKIKGYNDLAFSILQAARTRISKTEYISCPSCGRTLFDLQETTAKVREKTSHLKGLKIAVMGCIVNGPGEMADADYGYVGTGIDRISLYKKHDVIKKNIHSSVAVDELIRIIKENDDWIEPK